MVRSEKRRTWILYTFAILLCLVLASFWLMCNIYAKYTSQASGNDSARVALFGHDESVVLSSGTDGMSGLKPGDSRTYTLTVSNTKNQATSEVTVDYSLEIVTTGNLPLKYTVYKKNDSLTGTEIGSFEETSAKMEEIFRTDDMHFEAGVKGSAEYTVQLEWPAEKNSASYAGMPDDITVNINVEQVD